jgi:hypothetical protein
VLRVGAVLALAAVIGLTARVQVVSALDCEPAGRALAVRASIAGTDRLTVSYAVVNRTGAGVSWISIGSGERERTRLVPPQTPAVLGAPPGWRGMVVYPEESSFVHLWWETDDPAAALATGGATSGFVVSVAGPAAVAPGLRDAEGRAVRPIDFGSLPFIAGGGPRCWWGRVEPAAPPGHPGTQ